MKASELKKMFLDFFESKQHAITPSAPLVPENDPTALFITAGMQPLVPYLMGEKHPQGKRIANVQKCLRTDDIDEVGNTSHHTFFEMLGNWSLGDYWKKESIAWSLEFLTKVLQIDKDKLWVTCFAGDKDAPKDEESAEIWRSLGIPVERIFYFGKEDNWWGPVGDSGPCGPDTEIFYDTSGRPHGPDCKPGDNCGRFFEIWNNVFMQYEKTKDGKFEPLKQQNVDTGMGVERTTAVLSGLNDNFMVEDLWKKVLSAIEKVSGEPYDKNKKAFRIIADHIRASTFIISDGVDPSNKERGYVLRRLIRRSVRFGKTLGINDTFLNEIAQAVIETYKDGYPQLKKDGERIKNVLEEEENKFSKALKKGLAEIEKLKEIDGKTAFYLYESYGFPLELTEEIAKEKGQKIDKEVFQSEFEKHRELSRTASAGMFKGGLADKSEETMKLHTATHLLHASLRKVLGKHVQQKGSNIAAERLRFDFSHPEKLGDKEIKKVEEMINKKIREDLPVTKIEMEKKKALEEGALAFFPEKYPDVTNVYSVGTGKDEFSKELCGGPHVTSTGMIGHVTITKQEKIGSGLMRVYAVVGK